MTNKPKEVVLEMILENIPYYIFWKDTDLNYLGANKLFAKSAGFKSNKDIIGKNDYDGCWTKEEADFFRSIDKKVIEEDKAILNIEEPQKQLDGSTSTLLTSKVPLHNNDGEVIGILGIYTDITKRKKLELEKDQALKELKEVQEQLIHSEKMKSLGEMAGGIAHEINNPLAIIKGNSEVLSKLVELDSYEPKIFEEKLETITRTVDRISQIVTILKNISRSDDSQELHQVKISNIINDCSSLCFEKLKYNNIDLIINFMNSEVQHETIDCNPIALSQVVLNLISNSQDAIKSSSEKWIKVNLSKEKHDIIIDIIDSGHGINTAYINKIFQPFFTTKEVGDGTGVGLSLSKRLMEKQGGTLTYRPDHENTCFRITLPTKKP